MGPEDCTILLVEDDPNDLLLIRRAFDKAGVANPISAVSNGEEAVAYLKGEGKYADRKEYPLPVIILLDLKMPRMNGFEFLEWLRAEPEFRKLIVIVLTSSRETPDINRAYEAGANSYLVKPVQIEDLIRIVKELHLYWLVLSERPEL